MKDKITDFFSCTFVILIYGIIAGGLFYAMLRVWGLVARVWNGL